MKTFPPPTTSESEGRPARIDVCWLPGHPAEGSLSMQRYWMELDACARTRPERLAVRCPLGAPVFPLTRRSRPQRALRRYVTYPLLVRARVRGGLVHLLDHSSAHLIPLLPDRCRIVATVHDLIPLYYSRGLSAPGQARFRRIVSNLHRAHRVVAVSQFTAGDIIEHLGIAAEKIRVIPNGVDQSAGGGDEIDATIRARLDPLSDGLRILSLGSALPRKNLELLPRVFEALAASGRRVVLIRAGQPLPAQLRACLSDTLGERGVVELGILSAPALQALYRHADVLFVPSLLEGFGLPLLEAMAAGCPVVSSNAAALPEAGGDAALYFDPSDAPAAARQILRVTGEAGLRDELITRGRRRAAANRWERHLDGLIRVYEEAITTP